MAGVTQKLAETLKQGKSVLSTWSTLADPATAALLMRENFDSVVIDMQHGAMDYHAAATAISLIAAAGKPSIVRVPLGDFALVSRLADAGAAAVIAPMINTAEDARQLVAATKYPPLGERSWGPNAVEGLTGLTGESYFRAANAFTLCFAMFETQAAFDNMTEILAVPGLDGVFVGPADLSIGLSAGRELNPLAPTVTRTLKVLLEKTRAAGKYMAAYAPTPARAAEHLHDGYAIVALPGDAGFMLAGARTALAELHHASGQPA